MCRFHRLKQVAKYGWQHAEQISHEAFEGKKRIALFYDIFCCYQKYGMWSNQYLKERFWELDRTKRETVGNDYKKKNAIKEEWVKDFYANRKFLAKWSKYEIEASAKKREQRDEAYRKRYAMGKGCFIEYGVDISRQHHLPGKITIGNNVLFAKNVFIDYSGEVVLSDDVKLSAGVMIESHMHDYKPGPTGQSSEAKPTKIVIGNGVWVGAGATICESCGSIGRFSQIGAGSVVRNSIPPYSLVMGNPAKIVGFLFNPEEVLEFEEKNYPQLDPTDLKKYESDYQKFFINRLKEIRQFTKL